MRYVIDTTDKRNVYVKNYLIKTGEQVFELKDIKLEELKENDILVFAPSKKFEITFMESLPNKIKLICGNLDETLKQVILKKQIDYQNLMEDEIFAVKNASLTAEGVLAKILELSPKSIYDNNILILGGGRIAVALAILFNKLGVKFAITSFNNIKFPRYYLYTPTCYYKQEYLKHMKNYDIIVNTIPAKILNDEDLTKISTNTLFLETASVKCLNEEKVKHFKYVNCPALPTVYCFETAGRLMYQAIKGENYYD